MHRSRLMIKVLIAGAVAATAIPAAFAQQFDPKVLRERPHAPKSQPAARPRASNACAEYGAGFVWVEGTGTCMRIGGSVGMDVRVR